MRGIEAEGQLIADVEALVRKTRDMQLAISEKSFRRIPACCRIVRTVRAKPHKILSGSILLESHSSPVHVERTGFAYVHRSCWLSRCNTNVKMPATFSWCPVARESAPSSRCWGPGSVTSDMSDRTQVCGQSNISRSISLPTPPTCNAIPPASSKWCRLRISLSCLECILGKERSSKLTACLAGGAG